MQEDQARQSRRENRGNTKLNRVAKNILMSLALLLLLSLTIWETRYLFSVTRYFSISRIEITGTKRILPEKIRQLSGLILDESVFNIDYDKIRGRILSHPLVEGVEIKQNGLETIIIEIRERVAIALLLHQGIFYEIDHRSVPISKQDKSIRIDLPIITGITLDSLSIGEKIKMNQLNEAIQWVSSLPSGYFARISEIHYNESIMTLRLNSQETIYPGNSDNFRKMYNLLLATLQTFHQRNVAIDYIDMRFNNEIIVGPISL
jgi:cell division septal protein FtsQ